MTRPTRWQKMEEISERVKKLRHELINTTPEICTDRAILISQSYEETLSQPYILRRAYALEKISLNMGIYIHEGELIVGNLAEKLRGAPVYPEYAVDFVLNELDTFNLREADKFIISEKNKEILRQILPKWQGNTVKDAAYQLFPSQAKEASQDLICILTTLRSGVGHMIIDYKYGIDNGLLGIIKEIETLMENLDIQDPSYATKKEYYLAVIIVCKAAIAFANRFADLAQSLADSEEDPTRKKELLTIAKNCQKVPAYPAETFWEALQSFWFIHLILQLESNGHSVSPGRFDQYIYPYLKGPLEKKDEDQEFCQELIDCLWVKFNDINKVRDKVNSIAFGGYPMFQNLIVGGQTAEGECAVNELSYMCLSATERVGLPQPSLSARWYYGSPETFLSRCCEVASFGTGMPAFYNDEILIPIMLQQGYTLQEARDYAVVGCAEATVPGVSETWLPGGFLNLTKMIELTIFNGHDHVMNKQYQFKTGEVECLETFEEFKEAYFEQLSYYLKQHVACTNILDSVHGSLVPTLFESVFIHNCLENGKTSLQGGAKYNFTSPNAVSLANTADSLAAIKKFIYEDKTITWAELKVALMNNFNNAEQLRQRLLNLAPKYGNDDAYVDAIAREVVERFSKEIQKYSNPRGGKYQFGLYSISCHVLLADKVGATPDGRKQEMLLADGGVSCAQGRDKNGVTAMLKSVANLDQFKSSGAALLNVKLAPSFLKDEKGLSNFASIIKSYFMLKGQHIQFNVVDAAMLRDAQKNPEKYPLLVVRVAGFSVLFNCIDRVLQEDIIMRTEYQTL